MVVSGVGLSIGCLVACVICWFCFACGVLVCIIWYVCLVNGVLLICVLVVVGVGNNWCLVC